MADSYRGKTVVITGGSTGIGAAFAKRFAKEGAQLLLVARTASTLEAVAQTLRQEHGVAVRTLAVDLSTPGAARRVFEAVREAGWTADVLINNAGFATYGALETQPLAQLREEIDLNVATLVELTHTFLPELLAQRGGVIHVASTAAFQPVPYMAVYGATKAFVLSFSEALWAETRGRGLKVLALCPGATETPFFDRVGAQEASVGKRVSPDEVVALALRAFQSNRSHVISGLGNYWSAQAIRLAPRATTARLVGNLMRPRNQGSNIRTQTIAPNPSARPNISPNAEATRSRR